MPSRTFVQWQRADGVYRAEEPTPAQLAACAAQLAGDYNEPHNRSMMANTRDLSEADVVSLWTEMWASRGRPFLLFLDGALLGDADLRHIEQGRAEFAIMIGGRARQGRGLGTTFAMMIHYLAFRALGLERIYVTIIPPNIASRRLFEKLGYLPDDSAQARSFADAPDDVCMSAGFAQLEQAHGHAFGELRIGTLDD